MGVAASLYLPIDVGIEHIATALLRAEGVRLPAILGTENPFSARRFVKEGYTGAIDYWSLEHTQVGVGGEFSIKHNIHMTSSERPFSSWLVTGRSRADVLAVHEAVGKAFGGFQVWQDIDDVGQYFQRPDTGGNWMGYKDIAMGIDTATVTAVHEERAAYKRED